jgi:hypothetical protein
MVKLLPWPLVAKTARLALLCWSVSKTSTATGTPDRRVTPRR